MKKALFWDFDGTIIHPNESFLSALYQSLNKTGYEIPSEQIRAFLKTACSWYTPETAYPDQTGSKWWEHLFEKFDLFFLRHRIVQKDYAALKGDFKHQILDCNSYRLYEDANAVLSACIEKGYDNYILSNNYPELPAVIEELGLSPCFSGYIVSSNIGYEKPRKELFQYALSLAGFPEVYYMIGDNPIADIEGGKAAGFQTILVHQGAPSAADYCCSSLSEIPQLLIE